MTLRSLLIMVLCIVTSTVGAEDTLTLTVTVTGLTPNKGEAVVTLFDNKKDYLKKPLVSNREKVGDGDVVAVVFPGLAAGTYAASVYYDLDSDGEMDTGMFRIPSEPVGFSNNARGRFGPAKWKKTQFGLAADKTITVEVVNAIN